MKQKDLERALEKSKKQVEKLKRKLRMAEESLSSDGRKEPESIHVDEEFGVGGTD